MLSAEAETVFVTTLLHCYISINEDGERLKGFRTVADFSVSKDFRISSFKDLYQTATIFLNVSAQWCSPGIVCKQFILNLMATHENSFVVSTAYE